MPDAVAEPPKRGRGRPSAGAREAILAAALGLIRAEGLGKLTTREVARRAGVSEASVFYHYGDKVGLLQAVILAGLKPLADLGEGVLTGGAGQPLEATLLQIATALEDFLDRTMPVVEALQSDAAVRAEFAARLTEQDLGPHRGVRLVREHLDQMRERGAVRPDADTEAAALMLVGGCFLRAWQRHLTGRADEVLPSMAKATAAMAHLLGPGTAGSGPG